MKNKILNILGFIVVSYGLGLLFTILFGVIGFNDQLTFFVILPLPIAIAIYEFVCIKEAKQAFNEHTSLLRYDNEELSKQVEYHKTLAQSRLSIIDNRDKEIMGLKAELKNVPHDTKSYKALRDTMNKSETFKAPHPTVKGDKIYPAGSHIPKDEGRYDTFNKDVDNTEETWICPECGVEMKRSTDKIAFCDNIECTRKQWKKEKL